MHADCRRPGWVSCWGYFSASRSLVRPMGHRQEECLLVDDRGGVHATSPVLVEKFEDAAATVVGGVERSPTDDTAVADLHLNRPGAGPQNYPGTALLDPTRQPHIAHPGPPPQLVHTETAEHLRRKYREDPLSPRAHCSSCPPR
ncbi:hypothetical protein RHA1_ro08322 (plasmid) [Rhodococcus jostii RHA1]|uniref:Uncharacterized protein n=1 Tax=Rhodococcus jostii (strain RHA1) TaxID=101510 RepID=Q0RZC0_RHOJR|nr:hypothetical protein RHA1_ro08322 [Rhodococcus jostii RHA1]